MFVHICSRYTSHNRSVPLYLSSDHFTLVSFVIKSEELPQDYMRLMARANAFHDPEP